MGRRGLGPFVQDRTSEHANEEMASLKCNEVEAYSIKPQYHISLTHVVVLFITAVFCQERPITKHGCHLLVLKRNTSIIKIFTSYMSQKLNTAVWRLQPTVLHDAVGS